MVAFIRVLNMCYEFALGRSCLTEEFPYVHGGIPPGHYTAAARARPVGDPNFRPLGGMGMHQSGPGTVRRHGAFEMRTPGGYLLERAMEGSPQRIKDTLLERITEGLPRRIEDRSLKRSRESGPWRIDISLLSSTIEDLPQGEGRAPTSDQRGDRSTLPKRRKRLGDMALAGRAEGTAC